MRRHKWMGTNIAALAGFVLVGCGLDSRPVAQAPADSPQALRPGCTAPPCGGSGGDEGEAAANNLSFPVILPEGTPLPEGFPTDKAWTFANITDPATQCFTGNTGGAPVPTTYLCYFDGTQLWWLSQRSQNFWKAFSIADPCPKTTTTCTNTPVDVTAVDVGDLLESSPKLNFRRVRTEFSLLQDARLDTEFSPYVPASYPVSYVSSTATFDVAPCRLPTASDGSVGCFAAINMSGAVPGTEQSINEIQGSDFGVDSSGTSPVVRYLARPSLIDPTTIKTDTNNPGVGYHATVYSPCARLLIQKISGTPSWDAVNGMWSLTSGAGAPVVNESATSGGYSAEINAGGSLLYGYNWNTSEAVYTAGTYRVTFVLDGGTRCPSLNTRFTASTSIINPGEAATAHLVPYDNATLAGGYGGLVYIDVALRSSGGSGGGTGGHNGPGGR